MAEYDTKDNSSDSYFRRGSYAINFEANKKYNPFGVSLNETREREQRRTTQAQKTTKPFRQERAKTFHLSPDESGSQEDPISTSRSVFVINYPESATIADTFAHATSWEQIDDKIRVWFKTRDDAIRALAKNGSKVKNSVIGVIPAAVLISRQNRQECTLYASPKNINSRTIYNHIFFHFVLFCFVLCLCFLQKKNSFHFHVKIFKTYHFINSYSENSYNDSKLK